MVLACWKLFYDVNCQKEAAHNPFVGYVSAISSPSSSNLITNSAVMRVLSSGKGADYIKRSVGKTDTCGRASSP